MEIGTQSVSDCRVGVVSRMVAKIFMGCRLSGVHGKKKEEQVWVK